MCILTFALVDDNLLTARSGTEPPVELVSVAEAVTNSTAIDNSELSEDHPGMSPFSVLHSHLPLFMITLYS